MSKSKVLSPIEISLKLKCYKKNKYALYDVGNVCITYILSTHIRLSQTCRQVVQIILLFKKAYTYLCSGE